MALQAVITRYSTSIAAACAPTRTRKLRPLLMRLATLALALTALLMSPTAKSQSHDSEVRIDQLQSSSAFSPFTRSEGPFKRFEGGIEYAFRLDGDYAFRPLRAPMVGGEEDADIDPVAHALLVHAGAALSPLDWLTFEVAMPFALVEVGETHDRGLGPVVEEGSAGVGDLRLGAHLRPVASRAVDLSLGVRFWAPTGSESAYLTGPNRRFRLELATTLAGQADGLIWGCTTGLAPLFFAGRDGDRLSLSGAAHLLFSPAISAGLEPHLALFAFAPAGETQAFAAGLADADLALQFELLASGRVRFGGFSVALAAGPGWGNAPGTAVFRSVLTLAYAARGKHAADGAGPPDEDLDGIPDGRDQCPNEAGVKARQGCPDKRDSDGDGIVIGDACPDEPGAVYDDERANGCPDSDNDRLADPVDPCPREPGAKTGGCPKYARLRETAQGATFEVTPPLGFPPDGAKLTATQQAALREVVATLRAEPQLKHLVITLGSKETSDELTDQRARHIRDLLAAQDIESSRYEVVVSGELTAGRLALAISR